MSQIDNVFVIKKANVYFDGKCVSHSVVLADGTKKTVGVIMPTSLTFNTGAPEIMEGVGGSCRVKLKGELASPIDPQPGCRFALRCLYAQPQCTGSDPSLEDFGERHYCACFRARELNKMEAAHG